MQTHRPQPRFSQAEAARGGDSQVVCVPGHAWGEAGRTAVSCGVPRLSPPPASPEPGRHAFFAACRDLPVQCSAGNTSRSHLQTTILATAQQL